MDQFTLIAIIFAVFVVVGSFFNVFIFNKPTPQKKAPAPAGDAATSSATSVRRSPRKRNKSPKARAMEGL
ncbi:uncharacterized protein AMSG_01380 [Thecamonas trahens ATCC 50062]|uniref:Uncharacterized protein n=1 Tax=Thecamonas trahens ATCC 50062 TaxID=461836 RepID=A0A0L0DN37_THETB|nr:hypothetical protein AMSG_01380 [Thecamonas trahens ATCC 50062]KNC53670.1 hypothetical protein AMSG_01380 [Thecamonas trahens ATCC 50062]|eukprot:XP_013761984.1 hypothetical protein AMSG_01380 [Thecamonas trahens ATCC 50062]